MLEGERRLTAEQPGDAAGSRSRSGLLAGTLSQNIPLVHLQCHTAHAPCKSAPQPIEYHS